MNVAMMTCVTLTATATAVAAQITVPVPFSPAPFTLQVLACHPLRAPARPALRGTSVGNLRVGLRRNRGRARHHRRLHGRLPPLVPLRRPRGPCGLHRPSPGSADELPLGRGRTRRHLRARATWLSMVADLPFAVAITQGVLLLVAFVLVNVGLDATVASAARPDHRRFAGLRGRVAPRDSNIMLR